MDSDQTTKTAGGSGNHQNLGAKSLRMLQQAGTGCAQMLLRTSPWMQLLFAALLLRFLLMPFFCHLDFLSEYRRIHLQVTELSFFPGSRFVVTVIEALNYCFARLWVPDLASMLHMDEASRLTAGHRDFFVFATHTGVFRALFLLKLGYLLFDMATGYLLYRHFGRGKSGLIAAGFWLLNPVTLFSFYIFGRYESIALFFLVASLIAWMRHRPLLCCLSFALCLWSREVFVMVLPFFLIGWVRESTFSWKIRILGLLILGLVLGFATNFLPQAMGFESVLFGAYGALAEQSQLQHLIAFGFNWYYPLVIAYTLLLFFTLAGDGTNSERVSRAFMGFFLAFFVFAVHSVHYVAWLFPILCLLLPGEKKLQMATVVFVLSWIAYWMVATDLGVFTQWLAAPVTTHVVNIPNFPVWLADTMPSYTSLRFGELVAVFKSIQAACLIYMAYLLFQKSELRKEHA